MKHLCPKHKIPLAVEFVETGDRYCACTASGLSACYCQAPDTHVELVCKWRPKRWTWRAPKCGHRVRIVEGLTDQEGIARWIGERL